MMTLDELFEKYVEMRMRGANQDAVYTKLRDHVINHLTREDRNILSEKCERWERNRTRPKLTHAQRQALEQAKISNIRMDFIVCPSCDAPNAVVFTQCQVCNEALPVEDVPKQDTDGIVNKQKASLFQRDAHLVLKIVGTDNHLVVQPQFSLIGIKIGRAVDGVQCDLNLEPFHGSDCGVSRNHALIRYDRTNHRVTIIDQHSTNGTFVNGVRMPPEFETVLRDGDELKLAKILFEVKFNQK